MSSLTTPTAKRGEFWLFKCSFQLTHPKKSREIKMLCEMLIFHNWNANLLGSIRHLKVHYWNRYFSHWFGARTCWKSTQRIPKYCLKYSFWIKVWIKVNFNSTVHIFMKLFKNPQRIASKNRLKESPNPVPLLPEFQMDICLWSQLEMFHHSCCNCDESVSSMEKTPPSRHQSRLLSWLPPFEINQKEP